MLNKSLKVLAWTLLVLVLAGVVLWTASRLWPAPQAERAALQRLQPPPAADHDGFALLWSLPYDGPDLAARQALLAEEVAQWQRAAPGGWTGASVLETRYQRLPLDSDGRCVGRPRGYGCLAEVRADPQRFANAHAGHQGLHARIAQLAQARDFSSPFVVVAQRPLPPLPAYQPLFDALPAHALAHVRGDSAQALRGLCEGISAGRRMMAGSDTLVASRVGAGLLESHAQVLADVLVERPADMPLPAQCAAALAPLQGGETSLCRAMQGEFALASATMEHSYADSPLNVLTFDLPRTRLRMAPYYGWACDPAVAQARAQGQPLPLPVPRSGWNDMDFSCAANMVGCTLADIAMPAMLQYVHGSDDAAAMLRLLNIQRWLRLQPHAPAAALAQLPAELAAPVRPQLSTEGRYLQLPRTGPDADGRGPLRVPLAVQQ